jgi:hypothetical protein
MNTGLITWFGIGLGGAFLIAMGVLVLFMAKSKIDHGFLGLMFLLTLVVFLVAFSFLVAASVPGYDIKIAVAVVDAFVLIANKLLSDRFIKYLETP